MGIEKANGDWFFFCDADDLLFEDTLESFADKIKDGIDSICGGYVEIDDKEGSTIRLSTTRDYEIEVGRIDALKDFYKKKYGDLFNGYLWNRLLKAEVIRRNHLRFREDIYIKEDGLFLVQYLCKCTGHHAYTSKLVYKYRINGDGTMKTYGKAFNEKTCSNLIARCCCYEAIKNVTDDKALLKMAKDHISSMYKALVLFYVRDKKKSVLKFFQVSLVTFRYVSPIYVLKSYLSKK
jgi:glycosyltransferase involved in cell wall biosynthesis